MSASKRILVVEDEPLTALDLVSTLKSLGYDPSEPIDTGERAVAIAGEFSPDLILMDINLKGNLDGIQAAEAIAQRLPTPVVFLTAHTNEEILQRAKLTRPYGYLIKPFDPTELRSTIEITLHRVATRSNGATSASWNEKAPVTTESEFSLDQDNDIAQALVKLKLFEAVSRQNIEQLVTHSAIRQFEAGQKIALEGTGTSGGFIVFSGRISITKISSAGKELIVALLAPGDTYGLLYTLADFKGKSSIHCVISARLLWVEDAVFEKLLMESSQLAINFTKEISRYLALSHQLSSSLAHTRVEDRIISALAALHEHFGRSCTNANEGRIFITRRDLADLVGTTPETAIRVTKALERDGLLDLTRPGIIKILDLSRLRDMDATDQ